MDSSQEDQQKHNFCTTLTVPLKPLLTGALCDVIYFDFAKSYPAILPNNAIIEGPYHDYFFVKI